LSSFVLQLSAMQLYIATPTGENLTIEVEPTDRIEDVKAKIQDKLNILPTEQQLIFSGTVLEDGSTLEDYSIQGGTTLQLKLNTNEKQITSPGSENADVKTKYTASDESYTVTIPAEIPIKWGTTSAVSADYTVEAQLITGKTLSVSVAPQSGENLLVNAVTQNTISFSDIENGTRTFPAATSSPVTTDNVTFSISESSWKSVPIDEYSAYLEYTVTVSE